MLSAWIFYARIRTVCKFSYLRSAFFFLSFGGAVHSFAFYLRVLFSSFLVVFILLCARITSFCLLIGSPCKHVFDWVCLSLCVVRCWQHPHSIRNEAQLPMNNAEMANNNTNNNRTDRNQWKFIVYWLFCVLRLLFTRFRADRNLSTLYRNEMFDEQMYTQHQSSTIYIYVIHITYNAIANIHIHNGFPGVVAISVRKIERRSAEKCWLKAQMKL